MPPTRLPFTSFPASHVASSTSSGQFSRQSHPHGTRACNSMRAAAWPQARAAQLLVVASRQHLRRCCTAAASRRRLGSAPGVPSCALSSTQVLTSATAAASSPAAADAPQELQQQQPAASTSAAAADAPPTPAPPAFTAVKQLRLRSAAAYLPHPDKESYGGEDAHFVSNLAGGALGVADGVGGWAESGVNPAEYSRMLMRVACAYIEGADVRSVASLDGWASSPCASLNSYDTLSSLDACGSASDGCGGSGRDPAAAVALVDPRRALDTAHKLTKLPGSATACVVQLCPEQRSLIAANLGDSGFVVVRGGQVMLRSSPKQHFFDCPLQFGAYPEHVDDTDTADDAEVYMLPVLPGDVIVAGSDGLWDNMYPSELLSLLPSSAEDVDAAADRIAKRARQHAADEDFASPYSTEAKSQGYDWPWWMKVANARLKDGRVQLGELTGGKMDDITVLVAAVEEAEVLMPAGAAPPPTAAASGSGSALAPGEVGSSGSGGSYSRMEAPAGNNSASTGAIAAAGAGGGSSGVMKAAAAAALASATILAAVQGV